MLSIRHKALVSVFLAAICCLVFAATCCANKKETVAYFDKAVSLIKDGTYVLQPENREGNTEWGNKQDQWEGWVLEAREELVNKEEPTLSDAHEAIRKVLRSLNEDHMGLITPVLEEKANVLTGEGIPPGDLMDGENKQVAPRIYEGLDTADLPSGESLGDGSCIIRLPGGDGLPGGNPLAYRKAASDLFRKHARCSRWVIDLRENTGGGWRGLLGSVAHFLGENGKRTYLGGTKLGQRYFAEDARIVIEAGCEIQREDLDESEWNFLNDQTITDELELTEIRSGKWRITEKYGLKLQPQELPSANVPVALLLGTNTSSSAEILALLFKGRPATRSFGQPTCGVISANDDVTLEPDKAVLLITASPIMDRLGNMYYNTKLQPDEPIEPINTAEEDSVLNAALEWLKKQPLSS